MCDYTTVAALICLISILFLFILTLITLTQILTVMFPYNGVLALFLTFLVSMALTLGTERILNVILSFSVGYRVETICE